MQVVPFSVGRVSRSWDEQHLDVAAAAGQIGAAPTSGFTDAVAGAAARFTYTWQRHTAGLADDCESRADALRGTIADFLGTDEAVGLDHLALQEFLHEVR